MGSRRVDCGGIVGGRVWEEECGRNVGGVMCGRVGGAREACGRHGGDVWEAWWRSVRGV